MGAKKKLRKLIGPNKTIGLVLRPDKTFTKTRFYAAHENTLVEVSYLVWGLVPDHQGGILSGIQALSAILYEGEGSDSYVLQWRVL